MRINEVETKNPATKSKIPSIDYVINPYIGCQHGCIYCYAEFMIRFTGHKGEKWGDFIDIKRFNPDKIKPSRYDEKTLLLSSVTDPYQPIEKREENTRKILERFIGTNVSLQILTKSALFKRDIELFQKIPNIQVGCSLSTLDSEIAKKLEPHAAPPLSRLRSLKEVHDAGVKTHVFISPFFPKITDYKAILDETISYIDSVSFENINFRPHNKTRILKFIQDVKPSLLPYYKELVEDPSVWEDIEEDITKYCEDRSLNYKIAFHYGGFSKGKT
jgi:DNA repair photolyase